MCLCRSSTGVIASIKHYIKLIILIILKLNVL
nr:MAG TPA: hypothetical protein [Crassvirales sp.]